MTRLTLEVSGVGSDILRLNLGRESAFASCNSRGQFLRSLGFGASVERNRLTIILDDGGKTRGEDPQNRVILGWIVMWLIRCDCAPVKLATLAVEDVGLLKSCSALVVTPMSRFFIRNTSCSLSEGYNGCRANMCSSLAWGRGKTALNIA